MLPSCVKTSRLVLLIVFIDAFRTAQSGIPPVAQTQKSPSTTSNDVMNLDAQTTVTSNIQAIDHERIDRLEALVQVINANLKEVMENSRTVSELQTENAELRRMLTNFEYFFGSLYAEKPDAFNPGFGVDKRMSALNQYLGNKEAELAGLRPSPTSVLDREQEFDQELLGKALNQLTQENMMLATKVAHLQEKVDLSSPNKDNARSDVTIGTSRRKARDVRSRHRRNVTSQTPEERLATVESMVEQDIEAILSNWSRNGSVDDAERTSYVDVGDDSMTVEEEIERLAEDVLGMQGPSRKRKVAFSAARSSPLYGRNESHQIVDFDHIFVDKGRDYVNGTYLCEVTGFYFISFNLRSHDGFHLGVTLHKNDDVITAVYTDKSRRNVMESQSAILHLERGDRVYLLLGPSDRYAMYSDHRRYCTLNIFLLYRGK